MRIWLLLAIAAVSSPLKAMDRREFAQCLSQLEQGDSRERVESLLGRPDAIQTESDWHGLEINGVESVLCYGSAERLGFPTLGSVALSEDETVKYVWGRDGEPPTAEAFDEPELRRLLRLLDKAPAINSNAYDPRPVIAIVNALQPLGKDKAVLVLKEFYRVVPMFRDHHSGEGMILVMRTLFDVPDPPGYMGRFTMGGPRPGDFVLKNGASTAAQLKERDQAYIRLPRFPVIVEDDIPFIYVGPRNIGGHVEPPEVYLEEFAKSGILRKSLLRPGNNPTHSCAKVIERLQQECESGNWRIDNSWARADISRRIQEQVLRLVMDAYELPEGVARKEWDDKPIALPWDGRQDVHLWHEDEDIWTKASEEIAVLTLSWDQAANKYVRE